MLLIYMLILHSIVADFEMWLTKRKLIGLTIFLIIMVMLKVESEIRPNWTKPIIMFASERGIK